MPVEFKDYYQTLGVPKTATTEDIRKAFRKLARQYHPDVARDKKQAEEKFKQINEANEVLSDPEKRKKYDELGADWKQGPRPSPGGGQAYRTHTWRTGQPQGGEENFEFGGTGFSDFFEQFFGSAGNYARRGGFPDTEIEKGRDVEAVIMVTLEEVMHGAVRPISLRRNTRCPECDGDGVKGRQACPTCRGAGSISTTSNYRVKIPEGVRDGQRLRVAGQGEPGSGGGPSGDLFLRVRLASHPDFDVEGSDLYYDLDLAPWEAALGMSVQVPTLGSPVRIKIPPGTQNGQRLRVQGRGLPGPNSQHGDLYVVAKIQMPKQISENEKNLWEQLAKESSFKPRSS